MENTLDKSDNLKFGTVYCTVRKMFLQNLETEIITCTIMLKSLSELYLNIENKHMLVGTQPYKNIIEY